MKGVPLKYAGQDLTVYFRGTGETVRAMEGLHNAHLNQQIEIS